MMRDEHYLQTVEFIQAISKLPETGLRWSRAAPHRPYRPFLDRTCQEDYAGGLGFDEFSSWSAAARRRLAHASLAAVALIDDDGAVVVVVVVVALVVVGDGALAGLLGALEYAFMAA